MADGGLLSTFVSRVGSNCRVDGDLKISEGRAVFTVVGGLGML